MKKVLVSTFISLVFSACAHKPTCTGTANAVYDASGTCVVRIRSVTVASDLNIPQSLRESASQLRLEWVESSFTNGQVVVGHFVLVSGGIQ